MTFNTFPHTDGYFSMTKKKSFWNSSIDKNIFGDRQYLKTSSGASPQRVQNVVVYIGPHSLVNTFRKNY